MEEEAKDWSWRDTSEMMGQGGAWVIGGRGRGAGGVHLSVCVARPSGKLPTVGGVPRGPADWPGFRRVLAPLSCRAPPHPSD